MNIITIINIDILVTTVNNYTDRQTDGLYFVLSQRNIIVFFFM